MTNNPNYVSLSCPVVLTLCKLAGLTHQCHDLTKDGLMIMTDKGELSCDYDEFVSAVDEAFYANPAELSGLWNQDIEEGPDCDIYPHLTRASAQVLIEQQGG